MADGIGDIFSGIGSGLSSFFGGGGGAQPAVPDLSQPGWTFEPGGEFPGAPSTGAGAFVAPEDPTGGFGNVLKMAGIIPTAISGIRGLFGRSPTEGNLARMGKLSGPAGKTATSLLSSYNKGQLTGPQQAEVDQFKKQELAKWRQYLAAAGIPESSAMVDIENKINQDAAVYTQKLLQQDFQNAMQATGMAQGSLAQQAQMNYQIDMQNRAAMADAMAAIGKIFGSGRDTGTPPAGGATTTTLPGETGPIDLSGVNFEDSFA